MRRAGKGWRNTMISTLEWMSLLSHNFLFRLFFFPLQSIWVCSKYEYGQVTFPYVKGGNQYNTTAKTIWIIFLRHTENTALVIAPLPYTHWLQTECWFPVTIEKFNWLSNMSSKRSLKVVENSTKCQCITDVCSTRTKCKVFFVFQNIEMAVRHCWIMIWMILATSKIPMVQNTQSNTTILG